jgi:hypothetical protein
MITRSLRLAQTGQRCRATFSDPHLEIDESLEVYDVKISNAREGTYVSIRQIRSRSRQGLPTGRGNC